MLVIIDNYDSFTFNLVHYFEILGIELKVIRNDVPISECLNLHPTHLVVGPGPGNPSQSGIAKDLIIKASELKIPLLGVCLGMQTIAEVFYGNVIKAPFPMHGKTSLISHSNEDIFKSLPQNFTATRYHSLIVSETNFPECLQIIAKADDGIIMGLKHKTEKIYGVQFHPESILTIDGLQLLKNFIEIESK